MSKIICDLCGTSYSDAATQCPICGCARPADTQGVMKDNNNSTTEGQYHHVKGGRFSKSNVRKRNNQEVSKAPAKSSSTKTPQKDNQQSNKGLVITIIILVIAILAVAAYDVVTFFGPYLFKDKPVPETNPTVNEVPSSVLEIPCTEITLENTQITIEQIGESYALAPVFSPSDTTDPCTYTTADDTIATVNAEGVITAISSGETVITVSCGGASVTCTVTIPEPAEPFELNREEITLSAPGDEWLIYTGTLPVQEIVWASDDEAVATVENGKIIAVGNGVTTIYGGYNGETRSCVVRCEFAEPTEETDPTETTFVDNGPYKIKNRYGFSDSDATIRIGESFNLILIDKYGDTVSGVTWSVTEGECCTVTDGTVLGVSVGQAKVVATYNGESYYFLVRVK